MSSKINFDWIHFSDVDVQLSATEKIVIREHFNIWLEGNSGNDECSKPELEEKFDVFRCAWIMSQMFTG